MKASAVQARRVRRRGSAYLAVLAVAMIVLTMGVGGILASRASARAADGGNDVSDTRFAAASALEMARLWVSNDSSWRTNRSIGVWTPTLKIGGCTVSLNVTDTVDASLSNRPYDPILITATASKGVAQHLMSQTLVAAPVPLACLAYALHCAGQVHVLDNCRLASAATTSSNNEIKVEGTLEGSAVAATITNKGAIYGASTILNTSRLLPASTVAESYAALGTLISPGAIISAQALGPANNPYGAANADGVYVIRTSNNLTIQNTRVLGTLVIIAPGKTVTIAGNVLFQPARLDYPSLIVNGNVVFNYANTGVSEALIHANLNPPGMPYGTLTDADMLDNYPSELDGLIHIVGSLTVNLSCNVNGALIVEGSGNDAVKVNAPVFQIAYDPTLFTNPPQFYTAAVPMVGRTGSVTQSVKQ